MSLKTQQSAPSTESTSAEVSEPGSAGVPAGLILAVGAALPALIAGHFSGQIMDAGMMARAGLVLTEDVIFMGTAALFLLTGEHFGKQRHPQAQPYPGPFQTLDMQRVPPAFFKAYVKYLPILLGVIAPTAAIVWLALMGQLPLAVETVGVYMMTLLAQQYSEAWFIKRSSPMWGQVPHTFQIYRVWQLARGCWLTYLVAGPQWLILLQEALILLWVFNFGAVMTWTPWLYRWHLQPPSRRRE